MAHIGYIAHGAPYRDKTLKYADFPNEIDAILKGIIARGKAMEINFHHEMTPGRDIVERYYELGGRKSVTARTHTAVIFAEISTRRAQCSKR